MPQRHSVRIPGSTSNLGPGFDMLGLCLDLFLQVDLVLSEGPLEHRFDAMLGEARALPKNQENLVVRAFRAALEAFGVPSQHGITWSMQSEIPVARGLGSSGAALAAGLRLACAVAGRDPHAERDRLLRLGIQLEGHPDNVVASLLLGCTCALLLPERVHVLQPVLHPSLGYAVAWGQTPMPTRLARRLLPASIAFDQALDQPRRSLGLLEGLRLGDPDLLRYGEQDYLHVAARLPHLPGGRQALEAARDAGAYLATISGSGSSLIAIGPKHLDGDMAEAMGQVLQRHDGPAHWRAAHPVLPPTPHGSQG
ncbi:MAG: homoserine kinase [Planctomycetes bacterium]|nr:homoserine kinase [Planctomycetota bacterium]MCB9911000.1 homoserine kinase [Planctomycetota bacterium]HPF14056.1 homoserine kinase [Planctomycetota bacterium]HRV83147.1 homoserine kinase [Planctomycetota bacterium]